MILPGIGRTWRATEGGIFVPETWRIGRTLFPTPGWMDYWDVIVMREKSLPPLTLTTDAMEAINRYVIEWEDPKGINIQSITPSISH